MSTQHYITYCKHCQKIMGQCRCPGPKQTRYGVCDNCKDVWEPTTQPWIVSAAIRRKSDKLVLTGARHFDNIMTAVIRAHSVGELDKSWVDADQGFIDQWGRFFNRKEAARLAGQNGQCKPGLKVLFSEDLY